MPPTTLLLAVLLGIIGFFQGIVALPASSSTSSLVPESTNSLGFPLSDGSESTTALGGLPEATPTAAVSMAATLNSTFEPRNSDPYIYPPDDEPWVEFYNNAQCDPSNNGRIKDQIKLEIERSCYTVWKTQSKAAYILIHPDSRGLNFIWYTTEDCYNNEDPHKVVEHNITVQSKDMCLKRPGNLHSMEPRKLVK